MGRRRIDGQDVAACDGLCAAVLATPGVQGVTVAAPYPGEKRYRV
jgi:hypothetical protein